MWRWNKKIVSDDRLDRLADSVMCSLEVGESEINATAQSPFLYRRIRVRIEAEMRRRAEAANPWQVWLLTFRHAIPAMALVTVVALGTFWMLHEPITTDPTENESALVLLPDGSAAITDDDLSEVIGWQGTSGTQKK